MGDDSHGFTMTPMGILPIGSMVPASEDLSPAVLPSIQVETVRPTTNEVVLSPALAQRTVSDFDPSKPMTGKSILAAVRARVKELRKIVPALQAELATLEPILEASKPRKKHVGH